MYLTTHILFAAAATRPFIDTYNPFVVFALAFASHFVIDAIPHKDYGLYSTEGDGMETRIVKNYKLIAKDLARISTDILVGSLMLVGAYSYASEPISPLILAAVIFGAIAPDGLQPVYWITRNSLIERLQRFHHWIQSKKSIESAPLAIITQAAIAAASVYLILLWI